MEIEFQVEMFFPIAINFPYFSNMNFSSHVDLMEPSRGSGFEMISMCNLVHFFGQSCWRKGKTFNFFFEEKINWNHVFFLVALWLHFHMGNMQVNCKVLKVVQYMNVSAHVILRGWVNTFVFEKKHFLEKMHFFEEQKSFHMRILRHP